uniref:Uncharacterized protein n=1 Tax=Cyclopterus lumpus TaxID=8103 RepID=A0A8C3G1N3_CYCLU
SRCLVLISCFVHVVFFFSECLYSPEGSVSSYGSNPNAKGVIQTKAGMWDYVSPENGKRVVSGIASSRGIVMKPGPRPPSEPKPSVYLSKPQQSRYPSKPQQPVYPSKPLQPVYPSKPLQPRYPSKPQQPRYPSSSVYPSKPLQPRYPSKPQQPVYPSKPLQPRYPSKPLQPQKSNPNCLKVEMTVANCLNYSVLRFLTTF